jgi:hypothetical protein
MAAPENEGNEFVPNPIGDLRSQAEQVSSEKDFLRLLEGIAEICMKDDEAWERRLIHFVRVIEDFMDHDLIEIPKDQDWKWLAKLFLIGAFKN